MKEDSTRDFYEKYADDFEEKTKDRQKTDWIERFIALLSKNGEVLDLGCAYGRDAETFDSKGFKVTGIDFSKVFIEKAQKRVPNAKFQIEDIRKMTLPKDCFNGVWAQSVLLHVSKTDIEKILQEIYHSLRPGGVLFLSMYIGEGEGLIQDSRYDDVEKYYSFFSEEGLKELLIKSGFSIVNSIVRKKDNYERNDVIELIVIKS